MGIATIDEPAEHESKDGTAESDVGNQPTVVIVLADTFEVFAVSLY